jgi:hypothetical protein
MSSDNLQRFMSSPVIRAISSAPTSIPREISPAKDDVSMNGSDGGGGGDSSNDKSDGNNTGDENDGTKSSSDAGISS